MLSLSRGPLSCYVSFTDHDSTIRDIFLGRKHLSSIVEQMQKHFCINKILLVGSLGTVSHIALSSVE